MPARKDYPVAMSPEERNALFLRLLPKIEMAVRINGRSRKEEALSEASTVILERLPLVAGHPELEGWTYITAKWAILKLLRRKEEAFASDLMETVPDLRAPPADIRARIEEARHAKLAEFRAERQRRVDARLAVARADAAVRVKERVERERRRDHALATAALPRHLRESVRPVEAATWRWVVCPRTGRRYFRLA